MALRRTPTPTTFARGEDLTAAAQLNLTNKEDQAYAKSTAAHTRRTGARPWKWYDNIGEVHYAISRSARVAGYSALKCVEINDAGEIEKEVEDGIPADIVRGIYSPFGGTRGLVDRFYTLMKVPADSYLLKVRDADGDPDGYHFLSADELDLTSFSRWKPGKAHVKWVTAPSTSGVEEGSRFVREVPPEDLLGRVWMPNRRYVDLTDSALTALDTECETLFLLTKTIKAKLMSRFALAGLFFLPNGISTARVSRKQEQVAGQEIDQTLNFLINAMTKNVRNWEDATAYMPILLKGNAEDGEKIRHIVMDQEIFGTDIELRRELINRILQGLDQNQDTTKGTSDQSHFSAWAATDEERRVAVQPDMEMMSWAMTRLILHRELEADGMNPADIVKYAVWFDLSKSATHANQQEDARQLSDRGLISDAATRRMSGVGKDDIIDEEEYVRWVGKQTKNPILMMHGLPEAKNVDWDAVKEFPAKTGPEADSPADDSEAGPGGGGAEGSPDTIDTDTPRKDRPA